MERHWSSGNESMWLDEDSVGFDTSGTPMDQDWCISIPKFLELEGGRVAREQALRNFGEEGLRELLARLGGPTLEDYAAGTVPNPVTFFSRERKGPTLLAIRLMCDVLARADLPFPSFKIESRSTTHEIDGAGCESQEWSWSGSRGGVEAGVTAETAYWNPTTVASQSVTMSVLDKRDGFRGFFLGSSPPWTTWDARGSAIVEKEWLEARLEGASLKWLIQG